MTTFTDQRPSHLPVGRKADSLGFARPPSLARMLRQRGLMAGLLVSAELAGRFVNALSETPDLWVSVVSVYDAHLRRTAMEQAFAYARGDAD